MLCDIYLKNGTPVPFSTRHLYRRALDRLGDAGYDYVAGLEVEFYVLKLEQDRIRPEDATQPPPPPPVSLLAYGYHYLTELRIDQLDPVIQLLAPQLRALGSAAAHVRGRVRSEPARGHVQSGAWPCRGRQHDAVPQRGEADLPPPRLSRDVHVPARPAEHVFERLAPAPVAARARNRAATRLRRRRTDEIISAPGQHFIAGVLKHARASCVFTTPTINGYKRYKPYSLAPDRAIWGRDHKGAMLRVVIRRRRRSRHADRKPRRRTSGESLPLHGLAGDQRACRHRQASWCRRPSSDTPYEAQAEPLPRSLMEALDAFRASELYAARLGKPFVDYLLEDQGCRGRALPVGGDRLGAPRIFRDVLNVRGETRSARYCVA